MAEHVRAETHLEVIESDHRRLRRSLEELSNAEDAAAAKTTLAALLPLLSDHFEREEESGGLYETIESRAPQSAHALRELRKEHVEFREQGQSLVAALETSEWAATHPKLTELVRRLRHHESRENQLLSDSVLLDLGSGD